MLTAEPTWARLTRRLHTKFHRNDCYRKRYYHSKWKRYAIRIMDVTAWKSTENNLTWDCYSFSEIKKFILPQKLKNSNSNMYIATLWRATSGVTRPICLSTANYYINSEPNAYSTLGNFFPMCTGSFSNKNILIKWITDTIFYLTQLYCSWNWKNY